MGGMGTLATACFYEKLHSLQNVAAEQEYLDILLYSMPTTPDRTAYITGRSTENPLGSLIHAAKTLETAGADCIALPCITSHFFYDELADAVNIPIINMLDETAGAAAKLGIKNACLLATDGTIKAGAFEDAFKKQGIDVLLPPDPEQSALMKYIYDIKQGIDVSPDGLDIIIDKALKTGADAAILGCTELCIMPGDKKTNVINTLDVLAEAALRYFGS